MAAELGGHAHPANYYPERDGHLAELDNAGSARLGTQF
jgi:hypothetical protein